jgi:uncharacterized membrane protein YqjE
VALAETSLARREKPHGPGSEPSLSASLEHLVSSSQSVITRRIDLALLEAQELLKSFVEYAGFYGVAMILAACTWLAATAAIAMLVIPFPNWAYRLGIFALLNGAGAAVCVVLARRHNTPVWTRSEGKAAHGERTNGEAPSRTHGAAPSRS